MQDYQRNNNVGWGVSGIQPQSQAQTQGAAQTNRYGWGGDGFLGGAADFGRFGEWSPYMILGQLGGAASRGVENIYDSMGTYDAARRRGINALTPGGTAALVSQMGNRNMAGATDIGRRNAAMLRSQGIQGADASAMLDARNRAADNTNQMAAEYMGPMGELQRAMQTMDLSNPQAVAPIIQMILALNNPTVARTQMNNAEHAARAKSSGLGGVLGSVLGMATGGFGGLGSLFGGGTPQADPVQIGRNVSSWWS
jgi:hypothetical protein